MATRSAPRSRALRPRPPAPPRRHRGWPARTREEIFDQIGGELRDRRVLYLEFGVFEGASMRYWSQLPATAVQAFLRQVFSDWGLPERLRVDYTPTTTPAPEEEDDELEVPAFIRRKMK